MEKLLKKQERGITLIALVITIIVLLILAGVSISMIAGDNGILTQAQKAKETNRAGTVQEARDLWEAEKVMDEKSGTSSARTLKEVVEDLANQNILTEEEKEGILERGQVTIGDKTIIFGIEGITLVEAFNNGKECTEENCTNKEHIHVGDYITNYNSTLKNTSATVTITADKTGYKSNSQTYAVDTTTTWRVLGLSEDGTQLMITTGSPLKKEASAEESAEAWEKDPYLYLAGAESWYYAGKLTKEEGNILDEICSIYDSNFATETRSMRIEDINALLGITVDRTNKKVYKTADVTTTNIDEWGVLGQEYEYVLNDYAPENYLRGKYTTTSFTNLDKNKKAGNTVEGTAYAYLCSSAVDTTDKLYEILFSGTEETSPNKYYWLASSGANVYPGDGARFGPDFIAEGAVGTCSNMFNSGGYSMCVGLAVRPVVYLDSKVTVNNLTATTEGSEATWTTTCTSKTYESPLGYGKIIETETE